MLSTVLSATADVLEDLGVTERQFARGFGTAGYFRSEQAGGVLLDLPLTDAHAAAIASELDSLKRNSRRNFHEDRGDFAKALEGPAGLLDRVRLLGRAGRRDEARAALDGEEFRRLSESLSPVITLRQACRPLEDAQAWEELRNFLRLLGERLTAPHWRAALWAEELDLAWHLDRVQALLDETAGDPLKLAVFQHRLGNREERDKLVAPILQNVAPARLTEILGLLGDCPSVRRAALERWKQENLTVEERGNLFSQAVLLPNNQEFEDAFRIWVAKGGDALPLAGLIWQRWSYPGPDNPKRGAVLAALHERHPDEPRFQLLLGLKLMAVAPERAAEFLEKVASLPFATAADHQPKKWLTDGPDLVSDAARGDLVFCAIRALGVLNRQDLIRSAIDRQSAWKELPRVDQARYLAAGLMDYELATVVTGADFARPESDGLASWLSAAFGKPSRDRKIPGEVAARIAAKLDGLVAGSSEKETSQILTDAWSLMEVLGNVGDDALKESFLKLTTVAGARAGNQAADLTKGLGTLATVHPRLKVLFPEAKTTPASDGNADDGVKARMIDKWLALFAPPRIRRIAPEGEVHESRPPGLGRGNGRPPNELPLQLLDRWATNVASVSNEPLSPLSVQDQVTLRALMQRFGSGNPRRLIAEILIVEGRLECGDDALKAESKASFRALMAGEKEARGTEAFRLAASGGRMIGEDQLRKILDELKAQPPSARDEFAHQIQRELLTGRASEMTKQGLSRAGSIARQAATEPDADAVKFAELQRLGSKASPEAIVLAKRLIEKAAVAGDDTAGQLPVAAAVDVLQITGALDGWLKDVRKEVLRAGIPEVEMLRRLQKIDRPATMKGELRSAAYAREILALDPEDVESAKELLLVAADEGDVELLKRCLRALGSVGLARLPKGDIQRIFGKDGAPEVLSIIRDQAPKDMGLMNKGFHGYFLSADPRLAEEFRRWIALPRDSRSSEVTAGLFLMAGQLLDGGRKDEAVDTLARIFVATPEYPGFPHKFPPTPGGRAQGFRRSELQISREDLLFLREHELFDEVVERIEVLGGGDRTALAIMRAAANPDNESFEKHLLPILDATSEAARPYLTEKWRELFRNYPGADPIELRLLQESVKQPVAWEIQRFSETVKHASALQGGDRIIADQWAAVSKAAALITDPDMKKSAASSMGSVLWEMLCAADDETWRDYWAWRGSDETPLVTAPPYSNTPAGWIAPSRLRMVLERMILQVGDGKLPVSHAEWWALAAAGIGDTALLEKLKAIVPADPRTAADLCDLALGDPAAVSPLIGAAPEGNGDTLLWWNLASMSGGRGENNDRSIPRCPFPKLDGKFELRIMAGIEPGRLLVVTKLPAAAAAGSVRLKLAPEQRYLAIMAEDESSGVMRTSEPLDLRSCGGLSLPLFPGELAERGFDRLAWDGPGGMPAWRIRVSDRDPVDLLERPWNGSEPVTFSAWVSGGGKLTLRCLDAAGRELRPLDLMPAGSSLPVWRFQCIQSTPERSVIPAATVRLVLSASADSYAPPGDLAISNVRMEIGQAPVLPAGFERVARVPGSPASIALSPDARRLAITTTDGGLAIVDIASREVLDIPRPPASWTGDVRELRVNWVAAGLYALQKDGILYRLDEQNRKLDPLFSLRSTHRGPDYGKIISDGQSEMYLTRGNRDIVYQKLEVSDDGNWLIWLDGDRRLILASGNGTVLREIVRDTPFRFSLTAGGLHLIDPTGRRSLIKTGDFLSGEPVREEGPAVDKLVMHPKWVNRLRFGTRRSDEGNDAIRLFADGNMVVIAEDGTLYGLDKDGNLLRGVP